MADLFDRDKEKVLNASLVLSDASFLMTIILVGFMLIYSVGLKLG